jgi:hypothetical protein
MLSDVPSRAAGFSLLPTKLAVANSPALSDSINANSGKGSMRKLVYDFERYQLHREVLIRYHIASFDQS